MDFQYYPTGEHTTALMWAQFKRPVVHVCDPSAGAGHLIEYAQEGFQGLTDEQIPWVSQMSRDEDQNPSDWRRHRLTDAFRRKFSNLRDISAIEIDIQHHARLKELDAKIVGYDFLQVQSLATVSHVIMNPPFSQGATHVLHAWDVVYDAEISAIVNAETIRNPYSKERQRLVELIEKHGRVEFLEDQFVSNVERTTPVEVALIYLEKVPSQYLDMDELLGELKCGDAARGEDLKENVCTALSLPSNFIQDTCYRFRQAVAAARRSAEAAAVATRLTEQLGITLQEMQARGLDSEYREDTSSIRAKANDTFRAAYRNLKERAWGQIIRSSLLNDKLSNQARLKVEASARSIYDLEFSEANIHGFFVGVIQSMGDIYKDMICDLFDTIIERSSDNVVFYKSWKSNQKHRIGMRIRTSRFIIPRFGHSSSCGIDYEGTRFLADIDKVFGYLHGITGSYNGLVQAMNADPKAVVAGKRISSRFFDCRYYSGVGTIHFYPKSVDVSEKINKFVGQLRNWIPADMKEANEDFNKQYDQGESLTREYMAQYANRRRHSYGLDRPAIYLLREFNGVGSDGSVELDRLEQSIAAVHDAHGLVCGPALKGASPLDALPMDHQPVKQEQLLLLEA